MMVKSTITSKNQTTVPKEVRQKLGIGPSDVLQWEVIEGRVHVTPASRKFLERQGTILVGEGSVVDDIRRTRQVRGKEKV
jgi:AbrB family looped-hinge helix DNA binding protein